LPGVHDVPCPQPAVEPSLVGPPESAPPLLPASAALLPDDEPVDPLLDPPLGPLLDPPLEDAVDPLLDPPPLDPVGALPFVFVGVPPPPGDVPVGFPFPVEDWPGPWSGPLNPPPVVGAELQPATANAKATAAKPFKRGWANG
jgi:hypothetical protein